MLFLKSLCLIVITGLTVIVNIEQLQADSKIVVVPVAGNHALKNIVTVAKKNGDFTDILTALVSIKDASATNPYLIVVGPGTFVINQVIKLKPYVSLSGSGEQATQIFGNICNSYNDARSSVISMSGYSTLKAISIKNNGSGYLCNGIRVNGVSAQIKEVTVEISGGSINKGIWIVSSEATLLKHVRVLILGSSSIYSSSSNYGIDISNSNPLLSDIELTLNSGLTNYGIFNSYSNPQIKHVNLEINSISLSYAVYNSYSSPFISHSSFKVNSTATSYGVFNSGVSDAVITHSYLSAKTFGVYADSSSSVPLINYSTVVNKTNTDVTFKCVHSDDGLGNILSASCL